MCVRGKGGGIDEPGVSRGTFFEKGVKGPSLEKVTKAGTLQKKKQGGDREEQKRTNF